MDSPQRRTSEQYTQLERAGQLVAVGALETVPVENGKPAVKFGLPRQAVSLLQLTW